MNTLNDTYPKHEELPISSLELDTKNPRLPTYLEGDAKSIFAFLVKSSAVVELVSTIGENGYFAAEPLIGIPHPDAPKKYIIVEGNRRLSALMLLNGETFEDIPNRVSSVVEEANERPDKVPVILYEKREDVLDYLGNKHISGVKPWGALAKARYAQELFDLTDKTKSFKSRAREIARKIGSRSDFIIKSLKALNAYHLASKKSFWDLENVNEDTVKFSLLSTALDYQGIQEFVYDNPEKDFTEREIKEEHLKELFKWAFVKNENKKTTLGESRNLGRLSQTVASEEGLNVLRNGGTLQRAYQEAGGMETAFDILTNRILDDLIKANGAVADIKKTPERKKTTQSISNQSKHLETAFNDQ